MNFRTYLTLSLLAPVFAALLTQGTPTAKAQGSTTTANTTAFTPQPQIQDGVKITLLNARWVPASQVKFEGARSGFTAPPMFFAVDYRVETPGMEASGSRRRTPMANVEAIAPNGMRLPSSLLGQPQDGVITRVWNSFYGIDPRWKEVQLEFNWQDPKAPPEALGRLRETVEWTNITLPTAVDQPLALDLLQTTPTGTRLRLESAVIQGSRRKPDDKRLYVVGRWLPPESTPDLCAEIEESRGRAGDRRPAIEYDTGAPFQDRTHHISVSPGKGFGLVDTTAGYFTASAAAPPPEAKTVTLRVDVDAKARSLIQPQWNKQFRFTLPMPALPLSTPDENAANPTPLAPELQPVAESALGEARVQLLPPRFKPENGYKNRWKAEIVLQAPTPIQEDRQWITTGVTWYPEPGRNITSTGMNPSSSAWRDDGTLLKPGEQLYFIAPFLENKETPAANPQLTIESKWKEVQRDRFNLEFLKLPVPQPGQILTPDTSFPVAGWGQFFVRKIGRFDEANTLSPRVASRFSTLQPPYGLAVVVEYVPSAQAPKTIWGERLHARTWDFASATAQDASGRSLVRVCDTRNGKSEPSADDLNPLLPKIGAPDSEFNDKQATKDGYFFTIYLLPPAPTAQTFDLQLGATAEKILRTQTVIWPNVALPVPPTTPTAP